MSTLYRLEVQDIAGKTQIEVDGLMLDMDATARFTKGDYTGIDLAELEIDDIAVVTHDGELLYIESYKMPKDFYDKVEKIVTAIAMKIAENTPTHEWKETSNDC